MVLGGWPFEDHMRLDIWKKAQITTMLMIRCFIDTYVDDACWGKILLKSLPTHDAIHHKSEQSLCREGS